MIAELSPELADSAVQRFAEANFDKVMNKNGFFMGIVRRVKQDGPDRNGNTLESLPRPVRYRLQDLLEEVHLLPNTTMLPFKSCIYRANTIYSCKPIVKLQSRRSGTHTCLSKFYKYWKNCSLQYRNGICTASVLWKELHDKLVRLVTPL